MSLGQAIKDVLNFEAFHAEPDDSQAAWGERFPKKRTVLMNISRKRVSWRLLDRNGSMTEPVYEDGDFKDVLLRMGPEWKSLTDNGYCAVSFNNRFVVSLEANMSRRKGIEELVRTNPKAAIGAKAERGKRYALAHNPESNSSLLLSCEEDPIVKAEAALKEYGLKVGRACVGVYAMLLELTDQVRDARKVHLDSNSDVKTGTVLMVACCEGSMVALAQTEEQWTKLRSRADLYTDDFAPVIELLLPMIDECGPDTHVVLMTDVEQPELAQLLQARVPGVRVSDVTAPNQVWNLMADIN